MKKFTKIALIVASFVLVAALSVGGTLAWLQAKTTEVKNTFAPSDITIDLNEHDYDPATGELTTTEVKTENEYKMIPGGTLPKDPFVTVESGSEKCWVFVEVVESIQPELDDYISYSVKDTWEQVKNANDVNVVGPNGGEVFRYKQVVNALTDEQTLKILTDDRVTVKTTVTSDMMDAVKGDNAKPTLTFYGYAVQSEYLTDSSAYATWELAKPTTTTGGTDAGA